MAFEDEVIARINQEIGNDLKNLKKARICLKQHQERLKEIRGKVRTKIYKNFDALGRIYNQSRL